MMGDPDLNPDDCVKEYCEFMYGDASDAMIRFLRLLYARSAAFEDVMCKRRAYQYNGEDFYTLAFRPRILDRLDETLREAERAVRGKKGRAADWVGYTRVYFGLIRGTANLFTLYHAYQLAPSRTSLAALERAVKQREQARAAAIALATPARVKAWYGHLSGWARGAKYLKGDGPGRYAPPLRWDFKKMAAGLKPEWTPESRRGGHADAAVCRQRRIGRCGT